ncbi:MAG: FAD-dependent oxidoreductase [Planctomycetaceae bacterium]
MPISLSRRQLLAGFLGLPVALAAGCRRAATLPPAGEIVGASHEIGHRIRDGLRPQPGDDAWRNVGVVIVGGGIAGLSAAWRLQRAGFDDFVLLELESQFGGTSRSGQSRTIAYPWGAHYLPLPMRENARLIELLDEMGILEGRDKAGEPIAAEQFLCRDPEQRLFYGGKWYEGFDNEETTTAADRAEMRRFRAALGEWVQWRDGQGRRAFAVPVAVCSDDPHATALDRVSMSEWLRRNNFTSARVRWLIDFACRDDYGLTVEQCSAWAGLFYYASRMREPNAKPQPLITWPEGNARLVRHLAAKAIAQIKTGMAVTEIILNHADGKTTAEVIAVDPSGKRASGWPCREVIFAAPHFLAPYLVRGYGHDEARAKAAAEFTYGSWAVANLELKDRPRNIGFPPAWENVIFDSKSLGYITATHQRGIDVGPTVFTWYYPLIDDDPNAGRKRLLETGWRDWADVALSDLETAHRDIRPLVERLDVMRWGHAMVRPVPGFISGTARRTAAQPFHNVHFANTDLSGVALFEEAFHHGNRGRRACSATERRTDCNPSIPR